MVTSRHLFNLTLALIAITAITSNLTFALPTSLPTHGHNLFRRTHHHHGIQHRQVPHTRRSDDHGDVSAHDGYESQLHALEAALNHYEQYGDAESLQTYLKGFTGDNSGSSSGSGGSGSSSGSGSSGVNSGTSKKGDNNDGGAKQGDDKQDDGCDEGDDNKQGQSQPQQPQPTQPKQPKMKKQPKKQSPQPSNDYTDPQPAPQPKQPEQPKEQPKPQPQPQTPPESYNPNPNPSKDNNNSGSSGNSGNSINGYTPPQFSTSSSPSTASLYSMSTPFTGRATFYDTGLGACGITNTNNDPIVAISKDLFEQYNPSNGNPNHNSLCGRKVEIEWKGKKVQAFATDECPGCEKNSLDCSPGVFEGLDNKDKGVLDGINWRFI